METEDNSVGLARLVELGLYQFKSFVNESTVLAPVTVLVGGNASGKSNFFDALRILQGLGRGLAVPELFNGTDEKGRGSWPGIRGGDREVAFAGAHGFRLATRWQLEGGSEFTYTVEFQVEPQLLITSEELRASGEEAPLFRASQEDDPVNRQLGFRRRLELRSEPPVTSSYYQFGGVEPDSSFLNMILGLYQDEDSDPRIYIYAKALLQALQQLSFLELDPGRMRDYASSKIKAMGSRGEHFSASAWHLCNDEAKKQTLVDWISELCSPQIETITFVEVKELGDVMLELVEEDGMRVSARSLSDGTLRFLGLLIALMTAKAGDTLLIEEPETGLHPARAGLLVELIDTMARSRGCQVILTTHSPQLLMALQNLSQPALDAAIVFGRLSGTQGTVMRRLGELPQFDRIAREYGVDHLFTTRWMEHAI